MNFIFECAFYHPVWTAIVSMFLGWLSIFLLDYHKYVRTIGISLIIFFFFLFGYVFCVQFSYDIDKCLENGKLTEAHYLYRKISEDLESEKWTSANRKLLSWETNYLLQDANNESYERLLKVLKDYQPKYRPHIGTSDDGDDKSLSEAYNTWIETYNSYCYDIAKSLISEEKYELAKRFADMIFPKVNIQLLESHAFSDDYKYEYDDSDKRIFIQKIDDLINPQSEIVEDKKLNSKSKHKKN